MRLWHNIILMSLFVLTCSFSIAQAGNTGSSQLNQTSNDDHTVCDDPCSSFKGMPSYRVHTMLVSLNINDTPVAYTPPIGPAVPITLTYSQREAYQPANFSYFNLGKKWNFNWLSYVQDNPQIPGRQVRIYLPGGGTRDYGAYNANNKTFAPEQRTGAKLIQISSSSYERHMSDGSTYVYSESDDHPVYPRRIFLTQVVDASGNAVTLYYDAQKRLISLSDSLGQETLFEYAASDPLKITKVTDPFGRRALIGYDDNGRLNSITDAVDLTSTFTYDSGTFISSMTTPYGTTRFSFGQSGTQRWLVITDPEGEKERIEYRHSAPGIPFSDSPVPRRMGIFNRYINSRNTFYWDKEAMRRAPGNYKQARIYHWYHLRTGSSTTTGVLESIKNPLEHRIWYNYPGQNWYGAEGTLDKPSKIGRVLQDGITQLTQKTYNSFANITQFIDPAGREYRFDYAANGIDLIRIQRKNVAEYETLAKLSYNDSHQLLNYSGSKGQLSTFTYNLADQLTSRTNALGHMTRYEYNEQGYLINIIDANDNTLVHYQYDPIGRISSETNAADYTLNYHYDALDRMVRITYPDGTHKDIKWDKLDIDSIENRHGDISYNSHDAVRKLITNTNPAEHSTEYQYFANGLLQSIKDPKGNLTQILRDIQGRTTTTIHADNTQTTQLYDQSGRQIRSTDSLGGQIHYSYAIDDHLSAIRDPKGNNTRYYYDQLGDLVQKDSPDTGTSLFSYDSNGNRISYINAAQQQTQYDYDALNRISQINYADGQMVDYHYDSESSPNGIGRLSQVDEKNVTTSFEYDVQGNITTQEQTFADNMTLLVSTQYNGLGQPVKITYPSGDIVQYQYHQERLSAVLYNGQSILDSITYAPIGRMSGWRWGNGLEQSMDYDANGLLSHYSLPNENMALDYDPLNNLLSIMSDGNTNAQNTQNFIYDELERLIAANSWDFDLSYAYDSNSNRTWASDNNRLIDITIADKSNHILNHDSNNLQYDANGNILDDGQRLYTYDARGRMVSVDKDENNIQYHYNDFGQRISKKHLQRYQLNADLNTDGQVTEADLHILHEAIKTQNASREFDLNWDGVVDGKDTPCIATLIGKSKKLDITTKNNGTPHACHIGEWVSIQQETRFIYNSSQLLGEYTREGIIKQEYIWIGGQAVATVVNGQLYYIHSDQLGTPRAISDDKLKVVWRWESRPFGDTLANDDADLDGEKFNFNLRFSGQYFDIETGLHYNYFRYYDPELGRYITSDPIGLEGGLNTYGYVYQNPLSWIDPLGQYCLSPYTIGAISGAVGGLVGGVLSGALVGSAAGGVGAIPGAVSGAIAGVLSGAVGGAIIAGNTSETAVAGAVGSDGTLPGIIGSIAGGIVSSGLSGSGTTNTVAASGIGGAVGGIYTAGLAGSALVPASAIGALGGLAAGATSQFLEMGQDCDCQ